MITDVNSDTIDLHYEIEHKATIQALDIKNNLSSQNHTRMTYRTNAGYECACCASHPSFICVFRNRCVDLYYLCERHMRQCERIQSQILTDDVLYRRLKLIGPDYNTVDSKFVTGSPCIMCCRYYSVTIYYRCGDSGFICQHCKQKEITIHVELLWFLSTAMSIVDVRVFIIKLVRSIKSTDATCKS